MWPLKYLNETTRFCLSQHTGTPIVQVRNSVFGYWATIRDMTELEVIVEFGKTYLGNMR